jgi:cysteinyl-tRNA synthetase
VAEPSDEIRRLAAQRSERRQARDFTAADELRARIHDLGYDLVDTPDGGFDLRARAPAFEFSVQWLVDGWPEDVARGIRAFAHCHPDASIEHVVVDAGGVAGPPPWGEEAARVVRVDADAGWGAARSAGVEVSVAPVVVVVDGSVEPVGDVLAPLAAALADPAVGVAGPVGVVTENLREFEPSDGPDVDAIEGYLMAFRRDVLVDAGGFDAGFRFYRAADLELSFRIKDLGLRAVVVELPIRRHEHRRWTATPEPERDRLSKRNFYRFLDRFRDRTDLLVSSRDA